MPHTTITVFSRDKAYSDALAILTDAYFAANRESEAEDGPASATDLLLDARVYIQKQWNELQAARLAWPYLARFRDGRTMRLKMFAQRGI